MKYFISLIIGIWAIFWFNWVATTTEGATQTQLLNQLIGQYNTTATATVTVTVGGASIPLRAADSTAVKTIVINTGANPMSVYEGGSQVGILLTNQTWESIFNGKLAISASSALGTTAVITTYH